MLRMTAAEFSKLGAPGKTRRQRKAVHLAENHVENQLLDFMQLRGWSPVRILAGVFKSLDGKRHVRGAATGMPDWLFYRGNQSLWIEAKAPRGKLSLEQRIWFDRAAEEGVPAVIVRDLDTFMVWYRMQFPGEVS
jgi:hypothetical protein